MAQKPNAAVASKPETADLRGENRLHIAVGSAGESRSKPPRLHGSGARKYRGRYASGTKGGEEASESPRFTRGEARSVTGAAHHLPLLPGLTAEARARFWKHVKVGDPRECWEWTGARRRAYGHWKLTSYVSVMAHRVAYAIATGEEPGPYLVCHSCDNPPCCNPAHLWLGTDADNSADMKRKGRGRSADRSGEKNGNARLNEALVTAIWHDIQAGRSNTAIGAEHGVTHSLVSRIRLGLSWKHVTAKLGPPKPVFRRKPSRSSLVIGG